MARDTDDIIDLRADVLTLSTYRAFRAALGGETPIWDGLAKESRDAWLRACSWVHSEGPKLNGYTYANLTEQLYKHYAGDTVGLPAFKDLLPLYKLSWEAATRHAMRLIDDVPEDLSEAEDFWRSWTDKKLKAISN